MVNKYWFILENIDFVLLIICDYIESNEIFLIYFGKILF